MTETRLSIPALRGAYEVIIGQNLLAHLARYIEPLAGLLPRLIVVSNATVHALYYEAMAKAWRGAGGHIDAVTIADGESEKSWPGLETLCQNLLERKLDRHHWVIALGGGVTGDLAGFAASIVLRGINLVQIPTTLLAQIDSSVGGKTGINTSHGKNLIGSFYPPRLVLIDLDCLASLPRRELISGYAEIVKHALISDANFFAWLEQNGPAIIAGQRDAQAIAIAHSVRTKAAIVASDEYETGRRALLNFGHTFGHALEQLTGYRKNLNHGEAVAIGMVLAAKLSVAVTGLDLHSVHRIERHLAAMDLPTKVRGFLATQNDIEQFLAVLQHDKKHVEGRLNFILLKVVGEAVLATDVPLSLVHEIILQNS